MIQEGSHHGQRQIEIHVQANFITLATVGYDDVTPVTPLARTLAWMEAIAGQFYLAILVAGLAGFKVTQATKE